MKSNAPWSVKGIERDARETAKAAAQREGMTVGEWLNQIIYTAGDPNVAPTEGEIEGLRARDLAAAIEHLSRRISVAETKSAAAVENLARTFGGAVERLQRIERDGPAGHVAGADGGGAVLAARVQALEEKSGDRQRIEALRALEKAVGQIAVQFNNSQQTTHARLDSTEQQLQRIATRIEAAPAAELVSANTVREAIEGMAARIARAEKIAAEAAQLKSDAGESPDPDFVQKTGIRLRILGDEIKRGGDQIRTLEGTIARLSQQIDAAERRSAEGVHKVAETIADLRTQFSSADATDQTAARADIEAAVSEIAQRTDDKIQSLQDSFDAMVRRLENAGGAPQPARAAAAVPPVARTAPQAATDINEDFDSELDDAFAALDLEEPIPTDKMPTAPTKAREEAEESVEDDFGFEFDDARSAADDGETADVLAEIREAFGIDHSKTAEPAPVEPPEAVEASLEESVEPPPIEIAPAGRETDADYLKAARREARQAAEKAAAEEAAAPKKKLSPKQRAILAARIKRRKLEEAGAGDALVAPAPIAERALAADSDENSVKARVTALLSRIKSKPATTRDDDDAEPAVKSSGNPSILAGATAAVEKFKKLPNAGGVAIVGGAIVLLAVAGVILMKDKTGRATTVKRPAVAVTPAEPEQTVATTTATPAEDITASTIRPRDLYLDNIAALKSATTDEEARGSLAKIEESAALGHPPAQLQIGELYKLGQLYDRDLGVARQWFERAANGGNVLAMHRLGVMAARGEGGPVDPKVSIAWFEKAASFGLVDSQYNLGATYHPTADGAAAGIQDRGLAYFWYSIASKNGDSQAGEMAAGLGSSMPAAEKSAKDAEVAAWAPKTPDPLANELAPAD